MFEIYKDKIVVVTGAYGFKGSWMCRWLSKLGAKVVRFGHLPSTNPSHHILLEGENPNLIGSDTLDFHHLRDIIVEANPHLVFHLAAKAVVALTFVRPRETFENNVMGAVNLLEACRMASNLKGVIMITTDKVYDDKNWEWGYRENDDLGGHDPYSASKVCVEYITECYRKSFGMNIAVARAGNVIGGGDWSYKRLIPDIVRATNKGETVTIFTPTSTRPWQHALEALSGYLLLGQRILEGVDVNRAWNFGPEGEMTVLDVLKTAKDVWPDVTWTVDESQAHPLMTYLLKLDSSESCKILGWKPRWDMKYAVARTIRWYKEYYQNGKILTNEDIKDYEGS